MKKRITFLLSMVILFTFNSVAQQAPANNTPAPPQTQATPATDNTASNKNSLGLTQDQQQRMHQINKDAKTKRQSIMNDKTLSVDQKQAQLKSLNKDTKHQKNGLLTKDQLMQQRQMKSEKRINRMQSKQQPNPQHT